MTINPDKDLLIFRMRAERKTQKQEGNKTPLGKNPSHSIDFDFIKEDIIKPIKAEAKGAVNEIKEKREKAKILAQSKAAQKQIQPQPQIQSQQPTVQKGISLIVNPDEQINEIEESVDNVLEMLDKISEKQKEISKLKSG